MEIRGKTAVVTGASEGIGRATAKALAAEGASVVVAARTAARVEEVVAEIARAGGTAAAVPTDVADDASVAAMVAAAVARFGGVDILVNNAGFGLTGPMTELEVEQVRAVFEVNYFGALRCAKAVVPEMRRRGGGSIVNVSSVLGEMTIARLGAYGSTKHALHAASAAMRAELRDDRIGVVTLVPGRIDTGFTDNAVRPFGDASPGGYRGVPPERVARAILRAVRRNPRRVVVPWWYRPVVAGYALAPELVDRLSAAAMKRQNRR